MEKQGLAPQVMVAGGAASLAALVILLAMTGEPGTPVGFLYGVAVAPRRPRRRRASRRPSG